jgi:membrane-associated phospholipid phosphatase
MEPMANFLADAINPAFAALVIAAPLVSGSRVQKAWPFWAASAGGLAVAVVLAESGKWITKSGFPSGHETFALACATALVFWNRQWLWVAVPLSALLGWALVVVGWHRPAEVAGALLIGPPAAFAAQVIRRRREEPSR